MKPKPYHPGVNPKNPLRGRRRQAGEDPGDVQENAVTTPYQQLVQLQYLRVNAKCSFSKNEHLGPYLSVVFREVAAEDIIYSG